MIFPEAMGTLDDYRRFKAAVKVPILANLTEFGSTPFFTTDELREAGVDIALYCCGAYRAMRSEEHTSELQSLMRISYAVFCLKKKNHHYQQHFHRSNRLIVSLAINNHQLSAVKTRPNYAVI